MTAEPVGAEAPAGLYWGDGAFGLEESYLGSSMRGAAVVVGGLLLVGGTTLVVVADAQRTQALDQVQQQVRATQQRLDASRESNHRLAEQLTALRSRIYELDAQLSDTTGFLE